LRFAMRCTPMARVIVMIAGNPSGMAATASPTAARNISVSDQEVQEVETSIRERNSLTAEQFESALSSRGESLELFRANLREQLTINKALGAALGSQTRASESELRELYSTTYPPSVQFEVSHILLTVDADATPEEDALAREKAEEILSEISSGASFQSMASRYSQDASSAENGGRLGTFKEGELLPELEELAAKVEPGEVGGPVRTAAGYHILLLVSRTTSEPPSFAEVRDTLERQLMMEKEKPARERWLDELKETIYVEVFPDDG